MARDEIHYNIIPETITVTEKKILFLIKIECNQIEKTFAIGAMVLYLSIKMLTQLSYLISLGIIIKKINKYHPVVVISNYFSYSFSCQFIWSVYSINSRISSQTLTFDVPIVSVQMQHRSSVDRNPQTAQIPEFRVSPRLAARIATS